MKSRSVAMGMLFALAAASVSAETAGSRSGLFRLPTDEGALLGHVHLGLRMLEKVDAPAELLHAVAAHHDLRGARTAEAAALYHANQLDAVSATRPIPD